MSGKSRTLTLLLSRTSHFIVGHKKQKNGGLKMLYGSKHRIMTAKEYELWNISLGKVGRRTPTGKWGKWVVGVVCCFWALPQKHFIYGEF